VEFFTAFEPTRVPGGFQEGEYEYLKLGFCGPACCGGIYRLDLAVFFRHEGGLFGISRILAQGSVPLAPGLAMEPKLELPFGGTAILSVGWNWRF